jgi:Uma2 family endonuclease
MAARTTLTLKQFLALPDREDGTNYELSHGELITLPPPGYRHGAIVMRIGALLLHSLDPQEYLSVEQIQVSCWTPIQKLLRCAVLT